MVTYPDAPLLDFTSETLMFSAISLLGAFTPKHFAMFSLFTTTALSPLDNSPFPNF